MVAEKAKTDRTVSFASLIEKRIPSKTPNTKAESPRKIGQKKENRRIATKTKAKIQ